MLKKKTITIIGLGMIGGSVAKAFKKYLNAENIFAVDISQETREISVSSGIIAQAYDGIDYENVLSSDIIVLCTPVKLAVGYIKELSGKVKHDCIITDVCSTKCELVECINKLENPPIFIGGHPMAGREKSGFKVSTADLFKEAVYLITRTKSTTESSFSTLFNIIAGIGGVPVELDHKAHDEAAACISHLPHILAFTIVDLIRQKDNGQILKNLAAGGFKDITRIASSNAEMWENIMISNKFAINQVLTEYINEIEMLRNWINNEDSKKIIELINNAGSYRNSIPDKKNSDI